MRTILGHDEAFAILKRGAKKFFSEASFAEIYSEPDAFLGPNEMLLHAKSLVGVMVEGVRERGYDKISEPLFAYFLSPVVEALNNIYVNVDTENEDSDNQEVLMDCFEAMLSNCAVVFVRLANEQRFHANENRRPQPVPV